MRYESKTKAELIKEIQSLQRKVHRLEKDNHEHNGKTEITYKSELSTKQKTKSELITELKSSKVKIESKNIDGKFLNALEQLKVHDHLCLIYETQEEQFAAVIPFIRIGLERGEKCVYIVDDNTAALVKNAMRKEGIDVDSAIKKNSLAIITKKEAYLKQGYFDPDWMINFLKKTAEEAKESGFSALRATGEMTWMLGGEPGVERIIEYESKLNYFFPTADALAICQYNKKRFSPEIIRDVISTHPLVVFGKTVCKNFYYVPPDEFLAPLKRKAYSEVDRLLKNILEREKAELSLEESKARLHEAQRMAHIGNWELDLTTNSLYWSAEIYHIFEIDPKKFGASYETFLEAIHPDDREFVNNAYTYSVTNKSPYSIDHRLLFPDGRIKFVHEECETFYDEHGKPVRSVGTVQDITERKSYEQAVLASSQYTRGLIEASLDPLVTISEDGVITDVNHATEIVTGLEREQLIGKDFCDYFTEPEKAREGYKKVLKDGIVKDYPLQIRHSSGKTTDVLYNATVYKNQKGELQGIFAAARDITERKKAEEEIEKSQKLLQSITDFTPSLIYTLDASGKFQFVNKEFEKLFNISRHDLIGKDREFILPKEIAEQHRSNDLEIIKSQQSISFVEENIQGGEIHYYNSSKFPLIGSDGIVYAIGGISTEITKQKRAEEELRKSEERFRDLYETAPIAYFSIGTDGIIRKCNKSAEKLLGYKVDEMIGKQVMDLYADTDSGKDKAKQIFKLFLSGTKVRDEELQMKKADGKLIWISLSVDAARDEKGRIIESRSMVVDITERKINEEKLHRSENELKVAQRIGSFGNWDWDAVADTIQWSEEYYRIYDFDPTQKPPGYEEHLKVYTADSAKKLDEAVNHSMQTGEPYEVDLEFVTSKGNRKWILARGECKFDTTGRIIGLRGTAQDITERMKYLKELRESEEKFSAAFKSSPNLIAITRVLDGKIVDVNEGFTRMLGYSKDEALGKTTNELSIWNNLEDRLTFISTLEKFGRIIDFETTLRCKDGSIITVIDSANTIELRGESCTLSVVHNITERKMHEKEIAGLNRVYKVLSETNQLIVREKDRMHLLKEVCKIAVEHGNLLMAHVSFVDYNTRKVNPVVWYGKEEGYLSEITLTIDETPEGLGPTGKAIREKRSVFSTDISIEPMMQPWKEPALRRGYKSSAAFPLIENDTVIGAITVFAAEKAYFNEKELGLLSELAMDVSYALQNIKTEEERKQAEDEIVKRSRLLEALFTNHMTCFVLLDKDFNFIRVNDAYARACARNVSDFPGHNHFEFYPSDAKLIFEEVVRSKKPFQVEARPFVFEDHPDWGTTYWDWTLVPIIDSKGEVEFLVFSLNDVTERVTAEQELQTSNNQLRQVFDNIDAVVFSLDIEHGKLLKVSKACEKIYGFKQEKFFENPRIWMTLIHPEDLPAVQDNWQSLITHQKEFSEVEYRIIRQDGETRWIRNETKSFADENGKTIRMDGISYDITEKKLAEEAVRKSEDRYRDLVENSNDLICTHDIEGRILTANPPVSRQLGYSHNSLLSMNIQDIIAPEFKHEFESYISTILTKGINSGLMVVQTKSGKKRIWQYNNTLRTEGVDKPIVRGMAQDITERKKAEREIRKLSEAIEQSPVAVIITDTDGHIEYVNKAFEETTGYSFSEAIHHTPRIVQSGLTPLSVYEDLWKTIKSGNSWKGELLNRRKNGELYWEDQIIAPIKDKNNRVINFLGIRQDVTEIKKMTQDLIEAKERAEKSDQLKTEFLQQMSHEIRSPMNVTISLSNLIKDEVYDKVAPEILEYFEGIDLAGKRLIRTVDLILNTSEMYVGTYEPTFSTIDIFEDILKHLKAEFGTFAKRKGLDFFLSCNVEKPRIYCDKYSVTQVFGNLIDNAIKYTQQGKVEIIVDKDLSHNFMVTVKDTGIGISNEFMAKLFEPFTQEERGYSRRYEGNGLGLALVKKYCDLNSAVINVESQKGKGSNFTVTFLNTNRQ